MSVSTAVRPPAGGDVPFTMAAFVASADGGPRPRMAGHFNGKIDRPRVCRGALPRERIVAFVEQPRGRDVLAAWDFGHDIDHHGIAAVSRAHDVSPNGLHGEVVNLPARAMTGYNWRGDEYDCRHAPEQYGAIHFHDDDLGDAGWEVSLELAVPGDLRSGVYAIHLETDGGEDYVPFFVRPPRGTATAPIALLIPTNSYLAYANDHLALNAELVQLVAGQVPTLKASDVYRNRHREIGASCYDTHSDGSGVCYSTWSRPLLNVRPKYENPLGRLWQFNADLHLVDWLVARGYEFDVLTDQDLHLEGAPLLRPYRVVLTGSHPEYWSGRMLDAMEAYQEAGGRFMYLGGNGMYWVTSFDPEDPNVIEVRRWGGTEAWTAQPGEYHHSFTGEMGGLWRARGRPPQKIAGVGFVAQGMDASTYYRRNADSFRPEVAWIFEGVGDDELIGAFGLSGGGAAGLEIDWYDEATGSPQDAYLLASSEGHTDNMLEVRENFGMTIPALGGGQDPRVRADLVYYDTRNGGAVFSTGSIAWCGSLSHNGYENNVSRIMANVLDRFAGHDGAAANGRARRVGETVESDVHGGA
jgi:N,N-dimethylformamidase